VAIPLHRVVIDTNTLLSGIVSDDSAAASVVRAAETRQILPLLSKPVTRLTKSFLNWRSNSTRISSSARTMMSCHCAAAEMMQASDFANDFQALR
jgi:predicted nucleic acid-binding protein